ncbi:unnamed protein product [Fraxinus pennsylvanica]|uniref:Uncharacterized protein n=1 Tax=Fraxinus pennsylvanica TaxID=56036 RepID=A0AAD2DJP3_9LAMI|nr:unnamed protein product [Fraxinus pennsylvanica]
MVSPPFVFQGKSLAIHYSPSHALVYSFTLAFAFLPWFLLLSSSKENLWRSYPIFPFVDNLQRTDCIWLLIGSIDCLLSDMQRCLNRGTLPAVDFMGEHVIVGQVYMYFRGSGKAAEMKHDAAQGALRAAI